MTDTQKCEFCGGDGARRYTVYSPMYDVRSEYVCDSCRRRFFVTTDEAHEVLRKWASETNTEVDE